MKIALAEALLRRKELTAKVKQLETIKGTAMYEVKATRRAAHEGIDDIVAQVPKLQVNQVTAEYDWYAGQLRRLDAIIQRANWETTVEVNNEMQSWVPPEKQAAT